MHLKPLSQQTIIITGASSGIGLATARMAAQRGAKVVLAARDAEALDRIVEEINVAGGEAAALPVDVSDEGQVEQLAAFAIERFGGFDTWVNNAGIGVISTSEKLSNEDHRRIFDVNYFGLVYGSLAAARHFRENGKPGAIINLGSALSEMPLMFSVAYSASKHAIKGFTDGLRTELMHEDLPISVTLIRPSSIDSRFFDHAKTNEGGMGMAPGPKYAPSVVAEAILHAAAHPKRDIGVGSMAALAGPVGKSLPGMVQGAEAYFDNRILIDYDHMPVGESVNEVPDEGFERSRFGHGRTWSVTTKAQTTPSLVVGASVLLGAVLAVGIDRYRRR
ncbi:SDR family oxidoreductase [Devosia rhizoryzae]|uniref:SDR family NAD(P)-dependent oxidoreductase n=1 Tax=Devosia rhizoryzae TaxID=2774137 RepID=A0ABX7CA44_9HYPH|nr:SDR family oxidoreductase [Devosia rhizoryzae]QQR40648.1 SDR family NAD(P)-dependent oxidoreductase [Devosia rhizoryzae]